MPLDPTIATTLEQIQTREVRRRDLVAASQNVRSLKEPRVAIETAPTSGATHPYFLPYNWLDWP